MSQGNICYQMCHVCILSVLYTHMCCDVFLSGQAITGPQLATLLEILVTAANEGSLAEVSD